MASRTWGVRRCRYSLSQGSTHQKGSESSVVGQVRGGNLSSMICRYCSGAYAPGEFRCEGCGAPKGPVVQTLLDQSSGAMRWMTDFRRALQVSACGTAVLIALHILFSPENASANSLVILPTVAWMLIAMPSILGIASIMSAKGKWSTIVMNLLLSVLVWFGNGIAMLIGLSIAY